MRIEKKRNWSRPKMSRSKLKKGGKGKQHSKKKRRRRRKSLEVESSHGKREYGNVQEMKSSPCGQKLESKRESSERGDLTGRQGQNYVAVGNLIQDSILILKLEKDLNGSNLQLENTSVAAPEKDLIRCRAAVETSQESMQ